MLNLIICKKTTLCDKVICRIPLDIFAACSRDLYIVWFTDIVFSCWRTIHLNGVCRGDDPPSLGIVSGVRVHVKQMRSATLLVFWCRTSGSTCLVQRMKQRELISLGLVFRFDGVYDGGLTWVPVVGGVLCEHPVKWLTCFGWGVFDTERVCGFAFLRDRPQNLTSSTVSSDWFLGPESFPANHFLLVLCFISQSFFLCRPRNRSEVRVRQLLNVFILSLFSKINEYTISFKTSRKDRGKWREIGWRIPITFQHWFLYHLW